MSVVLEKKISISPTRQMTIPAHFYNKFGFDKSAILVDEGDKLVIKPAHTCSGEFDDVILSDLINEGYKDDLLLKKFKERRKKIPIAIKTINKMARKAAEGVGDFDTYDEVFG